MYYPPCNQDALDALKIIAEDDPKRAQALAVRLITQRDEDQFRERVKAAVICAGACLVGLVVWLLI